MTHAAVEIYRMKTIQYILTLLFGAFMIIGGVNHFIKPEMYYPFIPEFLPPSSVNYLAGITEIALGMGVFVPRFRYLAALGILLLMCLFLPLHVWDVIKEVPAIGSYKAAVVRLPIQFLFILWAWFISRK